MVRRIIFMLITLFALQSCWGAVAVYCTHETGRAAQHLGHHPDTNASDDVSKSDSTKADSPHSHCASCAQGTWSTDSFEAISHPQVAEAAPQSSDLILVSFYTSPPERPQWAAAA
jgi:hypothetical protein